LLVIGVTLLSAAAQLRRECRQSSRSAIDSKCLNLRFVISYRFRVLNVMLAVRAHPVVLCNSSNYKLCTTLGPYFSYRSTVKLLTVGGTYYYGSWFETRIHRPFLISTITRTASVGWTSSTLVRVLTLILLTWRIWRAPNNASNCQIGFFSAFKVLM
jgi:hypothetical protein